MSAPTIPLGLVAARRAHLGALDALFAKRPAPTDPVEDARVTLDVAEAQGAVADARRRLADVLEQAPGPVPEFPIDVAVSNWRPTTRHRKCAGHVNVLLPALGLELLGVRIYADDQGAWCLIPDRSAPDDPRGWQRTIWFPTLEQRASFDIAVINALRRKYPDALPPAACREDATC